jgi:RNA polymerase sigma-70 factor (ECF subfamily)
MDTRAHKNFAELFVDAQGRIYRYILTLVPNTADAEDIFQQTSLTLWDKWEQFIPDSPFMPWACGIARNHIRNHIRKTMRQGKPIALSEHLIERISSIRAEAESDLEDRRGVLADCLDGLSEKHRRMLDQRYDAGESIESVADTFGLSVEATYKAIQRVRHALFDCINGATASEGVG